MEKIFIVDVFAFTRVPRKMGLSGKRDYLAANESASPSEFIV